MIINLKNLVGLPVYTKSGSFLGRISNANLNIETHSITEYLVESGLLLKKKYLIKPAQVLDINDKKMTVEDTFLKEGIKDFIKTKTSSSSILAGVSEQTIED